MPEDIKGFSFVERVVPINVLFSNSFLKDLDLLWELREWIPDPTKPILPPNRLHH